MTPPAIRRMCLCATTALMLIFAPFTVSAATNSPWVVRVWQSEEGLPNNSVTGITQTPDGYLWVATRAALARFDGVRFEEFFTTNFFGSSNIGVETLVLSREGDLWVALDSRQVIRLRPDGVQLLGYPLDQRQRSAATIVEDGNGQLWVNYRNGELCRVENGQLVSARTSDGWTAESVHSIACDSNGRLWYTSGARVYVWGQNEPQAVLPQRDIRTRLTGAAGGGVWIASNSRLFRYKDGVLRDCGTIGVESFRGTVDAMLEDRNGALWIGTARHGLFRYNGSRFESIPVSDRAVLSLFEDREGNLWVGTAGGVNMVQPRAIWLELADTGTPFEAIQSLGEDARGTLWAATRNGFVVCRTNEQWIPAPGNVRWPNPRASSVAVDPQGAVWIGTLDRFLFRWDGAAFSRWRTGDGLTIHSAKAIFVSSQGDAWIAGEHPPVVQRFHDGKPTTVTLPTKLRIQAMAEDAEGSVWLGAEKGLLLRVSNGAVCDETPRTLPLLKNIRCLHATPDGSMWIGYAGGGVGRFKGGRFARILPKHGLPDHTISQIVADGRGWLWFGADCGIFRVRQQELDDVAEGRSTRVRSISYGESEGLPMTPALFGYAPGALRSRDGRLWIPMRAGLAAIDPSRLRENVEPPPVLLKRVTVDDQPVAWYAGHLPPRDLVDLNRSPAAVTVPPGHRHLQIDFTALSFNGARNVRFRYRLEGFDRGWIEGAMDRSVRYSRLEAGNYRFRVTACDGDGLWNETGASLLLTVPPFVWQTWWFRFAVLLLFTSTVIAIVRYVSFQRLRTRLNVLQQQAALDKERARIARDIHDDLGSRLTHITMLGAIALQKEAPPEKLGEAVHQISSLARKGIQSLDETVWAVNPRNDTLSHLVDYIGHFTVEFLHTAGLKYQVFLPDYPPERAVSSEVRHNLFLVVKEALNNVVRHAAATEVVLRVVVSEDSLVLTIEDNGRGFESAADRAGADGLHNMRQRIEEIGGQFAIESKPGSGTRIHFKYPWPP